MMFGVKYVGNEMKLRITSYPVAALYAASGAGTVERLRT
jgi:hypothetical protein